MKYLFSVILMLSPLPLAAKTPPADVILEEANQYTVKIRRGSTVGLNEDWTCNGLVPITCLSLRPLSFESQGAYAAQI